MKCNSVFLRRAAALLTAALLLACLLCGCSCASSEVSDSGSSSVSPESSSSSESGEPSSSESSQSGESSSEYEPYVPPNGNEIYTPPDAEPDETVAVRYKSAREVGEEVVAWVQVPGTNVDYPVCQHGDHSFYLTHNYAGRPAREGAIYAHMNNDLTDPNNLDQTTVLYGHNMYSTPDMFTTLMTFYEPENAKANRYITLTIGEATTYWLIYAVMDTQILNEETDFYYWNTYHQDEETWNATQQGIRDRSLYDYDVDVNYDDNVLILSTCSYHYYEFLLLRNDIRLAVCARLVREGETIGDLPEPTVNEDRIPAL